MNIKSTVNLIYWKIKIHKGKYYPNIRLYRFFFVAAMKWNEERFTNNLITITTKKLIKYHWRKKNLLEFEKNYD